MSGLPLALTLSLFVASASAQIYGNGYRHRSVAGSVVAGIVVAVVVGLLLCCVLSMMTVRRRRGQAMLPGPGGGFMRGRNAYTNNQSQVPPQGAGYGGYNQYPQQQRQEGLGIYNGSSGRQQASADLPPPPYPGKEADPGQMAAPPGGYAPPPGPPPPAHVNNNSRRFGCFNRNNQGDTK